MYFPNGRSWRHHGGSLAVIAALCGAALTSTLAAQDTPDMRHAAALSRAFRHAAETALPSVVTVIAKTKPQPSAGNLDLREMLRDPRLRQLFPNGIPGQGEGQGGEDEENQAPEGRGESPFPDFNQNVGSGVIIDPTGIVLTNTHVVRDAEEVIVRMRDGSEYKAEKTFTDTMSDIGIVRLAGAKELPVAHLGNSEVLEIGDWVIAIGSPFELEATVSAGIISGKGRGINQIRRGRLLQTDAAINPGNSGGPLVNLEGEVVGINTAIATSSGGYQGVGFAIPSTRAGWIAKELLAHGKVRRAYLGIRIDETSPEAARKLGVAARSGVVVVDVVNGSPAGQAGVKTNDVITEMAGEKVTGPRDLQDAVEQKEIGSRQQLKLVRSGKPVTVEVVMQALPEEADLRPSPDREKDE